jgi:hypothetical protein
MTECAVHVDAASTTGTNGNLDGATNSCPVGNYLGRAGTATTATHVVTATTAATDSKNVKVANSGWNVENAVCSTNKLVDLVSNAADYLGVGKRSTRASIKCWNAASSLGIEANRDNTRATVATELASCPTAHAACAATTATTAAAGTGVASGIGGRSSSTLNGSACTLTAFG